MVRAEFGEIRKAHFARNRPVVMAGHSRSKNGVASLPHDPAIHDFLVALVSQDVDARHKAGNDDFGSKEVMQQDVVLY